MILPLWEGRDSLLLFAKFLIGRIPKTTLEVDRSGHLVSLEAESASLAEGTGTQRHSETVEVKV